MKRQIFALSTAASLAVFSLSASAAQPSNAQLKAEISKISQETAALQNEVQSLKAQLKHRRGYRRRAKRPLVHTTVTPVHEVHEQAKSLHRPIVTVTTSPWFGLRTHFRPIDILEYQGSMNEDLYLLQHRQKFIHELDAIGEPLDRPMLQISGGVEAQAIQDVNSGNGSISLSTVELDFNAVASNWANAFISLNYDSSPAITGSREPDGRVFLNRGFVTIGDLDYTPFYFSMGQMYVPFGKYYNVLLTSPITESLARILTRTMLFGFSSHGVYASIYAFSGDLTTRSNGLINQGGFNLGFDHDYGPVNIDLGGGVVSNIADSQGMQRNGINMAGFFNGYGEPTTFLGTTIPQFDNLRHRVPAVDGHAELSYKALTLVAEYITATQAFDWRDMTFNGRLATPQALHTELALSFHIRWLPITIAGMYDESWQAYALNLPQESFSVGILTSFWKDTVEGIEFRHNTAYPGGTVATGGTLLTPQFPINGIQVPVPISNGQASNLITGQIGVYF